MAEQPKSIAVISESYLSRPFQVGLKSNSRELIFDISGTDNELTVQSLLESTAPAVYQGLVLDTLEAEPIEVESGSGNGIWKGHAKYISPEVEYSFDIGGGTQKVTQSIYTVASYAPSGMTAPDFGGAIGVSEDAVEGVDLPGPKFEFSETHVFSDSSITTAYKNVLFQLSRPTKNKDPFKGFAAGEVIFLGVTGSNKGSGQWTLSFKFSASPNISGLTIGDIGPIDKLGWQYLWMRYADYADTTAFALVKRPISAYVEEVIPDGDFSLLLIGV